MERQGTIEEISDGKLYGGNDMVKADCHDCAGCCECCKGMGISIQLDPLDIHRISSYEGKGFEKLLEESVQLNLVSGLILPNMKMDGQKEACYYLDSKGRCRIHKARPGICRLFPLGRYYENREFHYFLQVNQCKNENRSKIKVKKWIDTPELKKYEDFTVKWHFFIKDIQEYLVKSGDKALAKEMGMYILTSFYMKPFSETQDFYGEFENRLLEANNYVQEKIQSLSVQSSTAGV